MLRLRDWADVEGMKVDRKDMEALRVANDLQVEGVVQEKDTSFAFDSTPAANKVDKSLIDGGNMVNVIQQALEIRLGKQGDAAGGSVLNGAQTSAAMMASDFLLEELNRIAAKYPNGQVQISDDLDGTLGARPGSGKGSYASAYGFDADDDEGQESSDAEMSAMWGGGISMSSGED